MEMVNNLIMKYIVYCTTNLINKKIYIGVHLTLDDSFDGYIGCGVYVNHPGTYNHPKTYFQAAVQKYGPKNFKRITLKLFDNEEDAYSLEADIVNEDFLKRKDVYNMVLGGYGGDRGSNAKHCYQYTLEGEFVKEYPSQQQASYALNCGFTTIKRAIHEKIKAVGYYWTEVYVEKLDLSEFKTSTNKIPVFLYSETGEYDCCYESISDAARVNNVGSSKIVRACKLGYKVGNKYFSYVFNSSFDKANNISVRNRVIYQYGLSGEFIKEFKSCSEAERELNVKSGLSQAIKLGRTFAGYQWKLEKFDKIDSVEIKSAPRKVGLYDLLGNLIKVFNTVRECTELFSGCRHVLLGKRKTSGGYIFKYVD